MLDNLVIASEASESSLTLVANHARDDALAGLWSSPTFRANGLKSSAGPTATVKAEIQPIACRSGTGEMGRVRRRRSVVFPHALDLCLIHAFGKRQNGSLFESAHGAAAAPDGCSPRRICTAYVATEVSRVIPDFWRALERYAPARHPRKKHGLQQLNHQGAQ
jgi:hypothetical protein